MSELVKYTFSLKQLTENHGIAWQFYIFLDVELGEVESNVNVGYTAVG